MARTRRGSFEVETTVTVYVSDVLEDIDTEDLIDELKSRKQYALVNDTQVAPDAEFLEDLARSLELGRAMDACERRLAALRLREMISPDNKRADRIAQAYRRWQSERGASH